MGARWAAVALAGWLLAAAAAAAAAGGVKGGGNRDPQAVVANRSEACAPCPAPTPGPCRIPWALVAHYRSVPGLGVYRVHTRRATWDAAKRVCEAEGTHLAVINSQAEADLFKQFYREAGNKDWLFLGFRRGSDGKFYTVQGQPLERAGYVRWGTDEPNNAYGNEQCGFLLGSGLLADGWCDASLAFVCEAPL